MAGEPRAEPLALPPEYGRAEVLLDWPAVRKRLEAALHYWQSTVRPDGRPHVVPLDGLWLADRWYFGGSPKTVKHRNLQENPHAVVTIEDAESAVIVEGVCSVIVPDQEFARRLSELSEAKYGYGPEPATYARGVWELRPTRVLAWNRFPRDATRFVFDGD